MTNTSQSFWGINNVDLAFWTNHYWNKGSGAANLSLVSARMKYYAQGGMNLERLSVDSGLLEYGINQANTSNGKAITPYLAQLLLYIQDASAAGQMVDLVPSGAYNSPADDTGPSGANTIGTAPGTVNATEQYGQIGYKIPGYTTSSTADFVSFWTTVATFFKNNQNLIFTLANEPNAVFNGDNSQANLMLLAQSWFTTAIAAVNAIRATGATQEITIPPPFWAWGAINYFAGSKFQSLLDQDLRSANSVLGNNNVALNLHEYFSGRAISDGSVGVADLIYITQWARQYHGRIKLYAGELDAEANSSPNDQTQQAIVNMIAFMKANSDVWQGGSFWSSYDPHVFSSGSSTNTGVDANLDPTFNSNGTISSTQTQMNTISQAITSNAAPRSLAINASSLSLGSNSYYIVAGNSNTIVVGNNDLVSITGFGDVVNLTGIGSSIQSVGGNAKTPIVP